MRVMGGPFPEIAALLALDALGCAGATAVTVQRDQDARERAAAGASHVLHPYRDAADYAADYAAGPVAGDHLGQVS